MKTRGHRFEASQDNPHSANVLDRSTGIVLTSTISGLTAPYAAEIAHLLNRGNANRLAEVAPAPPSPGERYRSVYLALLAGGQSPVRIHGTAEAIVDEDLDLYPSERGRTT